MSPTIYIILYTDFLTWDNNNNLVMVTGWIISQNEEIVGKIFYLVFQELCN